jgi:hypothetical protein
LLLTLCTELEKMAAEADAELGRGDDGSLEADFAKEAPGEAKYRTLEQMSKDIKGLDEVRSYHQGSARCTLGLSK